MHRLSARLFGTLQLDSMGQTLHEMKAYRAQEVLCYLMLNRDRVHPREVLAAQFWGESSTHQSRKYLRQALWKLQSVLHVHDTSLQNRILHVDTDSVSLQSGTEVWLDVAIFEQAFNEFRLLPGNDLTPTSVERVRNAVELYRGPLLEGWYQDWCLFHRQRLQSCYFVLLDRLIEYYLAHHDFTAGLECGERMLYYDQAYEHGHRQLMRLHYMLGNRVEALRQFERCAACLERELSVSPSAETVQLCEQIRLERLEPSLFVRGDDTMSRAVVVSWTDDLTLLKQRALVLRQMEQQVREEIRSIEDKLSSSETDRARSGPIVS